MTFRRAGESYLVCPRLLELDPRHGEHCCRWPPCRRGHDCDQDHEHEELLVDEEGHSSVHWSWLAGADHIAPERFRCRCGRVMVRGDHDDPNDPELLTAAAGEESGP